jgi:hypothetical protein
MNEQNHAESPRLAIDELLQAPPEKQPQLARQIAFKWARHDINAMWHAVSRSTLDAHLKQSLFNELWN